MSSNIFEKAFVHVLREAPEPVESDPTAGISDADAMAQTLDKGTNPADFDADTGAAADHMAAASKMQASMVAELNAWISQLDQFAKFLNATTADSVQQKLKKAIPNTLFDKIRVAEAKKIARVAMEVSSLNEMLKGYSATANNPTLRGV
jgi:hypothetical protein